MPNDTYKIPTLQELKRRGWKIHRDLHQLIGPEPKNATDKQRHKVAQLLGILLEMGNGPMIEAVLKRVDSALDKRDAAITKVLKEDIEEIVERTIMRMENRRDAERFNRYKTHVISVAIGAIVTAVIGLWLKHLGIV